jgi:hypothetical protein
MGDKLVAQLQMQEENSTIQSPCFFELADKLVAHLVPN